MNKVVNPDKDRRAFLDNKETIEQYVSALLKTDLSGVDSMHDKMTGLCNTRGFYYNSAKKIAMNPDINYAVALIDLHEFKMVNEFYGRGEGDKLILHISELVKACVTNDNWETAHLRADNFAMLIPYKNVHDVESVLEYICNGIMTYPISCRLNPAFGVCLVLDHSEHVDTLTNCARIALNTVKGNVLKHLAYFTDELKAKVAAIKKIETRMNEAQAKGEFMRTFSQRLI